MDTSNDKPVKPGNSAEREVRLWRNRTLLCIAVTITALVEVGTVQVTESPRWMAVGCCILALLFTTTALAAWHDARRRDARTAPRDVSRM